jgi:hypothetical protein
MNLQRVMAQAVIRWTLTAEDRVRCHASPSEVCAGQSGNGTGCEPELQFSPVSIIPPMLRSHSRIPCGWTMDALEAAFPFVRDKFRKTSPLACDFCDN